MSRVCKWQTHVANARVALMDVIIVIVGSTGNVDVVDEPLEFLCFKCLNVLSYKKTNMG